VDISGATEGEGSRLAWEISQKQSIHDERAGAAPDLEGRSGRPQRSRSREVYFGGIIPDSAPAICLHFPCCLIKVWVKRDLPLTATPL